MKCETDKVCNYLNNMSIVSMVNFIQIMFLITCICIFLKIHSFIKQSSADINSLHTKESHTKN